MSCATTVHFTSKKAFISQICKDLQKLKKDYVENKCRIPRAYNKIVYLDYKNGKKYRWFFTITVRDTFTVELCAVHEEGNDKVLSYFSSDLKRFKGDETYNVCRNITEFREFLKREVHEDV